MSGEGGSGSAALSAPDPVYRTTPERTAKMMAIMLGICVAGGGIFFAMWDYWISAPPPVAEMMAGGEALEPVDVEETGTEIPVSFSFVESADFRVMAFNALPGEPDNNPVIRAEPGDKIVFDVVNDGTLFHAFGVTPADSGIAPVYPGSEVGTGSSPLNPGQGGAAEFVAPEEGVFYYICTVQGHRQQGMEGVIIVGDAEEPVREAAAPAAPAEPAPVPAEMEAVPYDGPVSLPAGSSVAGCEADALCYVPAHVEVAPGTEVVWSNDDNAAHTVTGGPAPAPGGEFDSGLFVAGATFSHTFEEPGTFPYICIVHPWMTGAVTVTGAEGEMAEPGMEGDTEPGMEGDTEPGMEGDTEPGMAEPGMEGDTEPGMEGDTEPGMEGDTEPGMAEPGMEGDTEPGMEGDTEPGMAEPVTVSVPQGTAIKGCERDDACYIPAHVEVAPGTEVVWSNDDSAAHTVTGGNNVDGPDGEIDSGLFMAGTTFSHTFESAGEFDYYCIVHPWMVGTVTVG